MDVKGANPFLFTEEEYTSPNASNSNPFLMAEDDFVEEPGNDNPFLSQTTTTASSNSNSTNPFAFDPMDSGPTEGQPVEIVNNFQISNQFADAGSFDSPITNTIIPNIIPEKPTELNLKFTNTVASDNEKLDFNGRNGGPPRPPPPRPPPSKETQDLLMSVMGAMDATSSHLLDRIPPTRTPSPVSMRDLHSPSPTPEPFADFLDVDESKPADTNPINKNTHSGDLLSLNHDSACDINQNPPLLQNNPAVQILPSKPMPPVRPPRPQPPQKPPPPKFTQQNTSPPKPPPANIEPQEAEMVNLFGMEEKPAQKTMASTADIMSLFNAPITTKPALTDLLCDSVEPTMITEVNQVLSPTSNEMDTSGPNLFDNNSEPTPTASNNEALDSFVTTPIIQDNFISPEPSQADLQMDTSDSQSKGSVSSVTFNPFAATDDNAVTSPKQNDVFQQDNIATLDNGAFQAPDSFGTNVISPQKINNLTSLPEVDLFNPQPTATFKQSENNFSFNNVTKEHDEFDAFSVKFESARDENKNGFTDAFPVSGNAWGNEQMSFNDPSTGGFGADESFDAFLALQEPPAVPQSTPNRLNKVGSLDSDEDKDFSVIIRPKSNEDAFANSILPVLAPPPAPTQSAFNDTSPRFNPFDQQSEIGSTAIGTEIATPFGEYSIMNF